MKLDALRVTDCRNIEQAALWPSEGLTVIAGANGQGKTALLECIFLLTGSKSFRGAKDFQLIRRGQAEGRVAGEVSFDDRERLIEVTVAGGQGGRAGRFAKVNEVDYGRAGEIAGIFTAVVFEPNHLSLVKAGPGVRRRFLDAALCQLYPGYLSVLRRFMRALAQKNAVLRRCHELADAEAQLDVFDAELTETGGVISGRRAAWLSQAGPMAERYYSEISQGAERLELAFIPAAPAGALAEKLAATRARDIRAGFSTAGPQREDFEVTLCGQSARVYGSQGQQRSVVLALKLAEAEMASQVAGQHPVLLLDDVLSELDETRQGYLLEHMAGKQSFVTCCDPAVFAKTAGKVVFIKAGRLREDG